MSGDAGDGLVEVNGLFARLAVQDPAGSPGDLVVVMPEALQEARDVILEAFDSWSAQLYDDAANDELVDDLRYAADGADARRLLEAVDATTVGDIDADIRSRTRLQVNLEKALLIADPKRRQASVEDALQTERQVLTGRHATRLTRALQFSADYAARRL